MEAERSEMERRREARFPVRLQCWIQRESLTLLGTALNISRQGVFIRTLPGLEPGSTISLEIGSGEDSVEARGRVVWSAGSDTSCGGHPGVGVLLTEILSGADRLERLIEQETQNGMIQ